jgi:hypothetical protein
MESAFFLKQNKTCATPPFHTERQLKAIRLLKSPSQAKDRA